MLITYKHKEYFKCYNIDEFIAFMDKYLKNSFNYKSINNVLQELNLFYNNTDKIGFKKFKTFCYSLIGEKSRYRTNFWVKRGYTQNEANNKISKLQTINANAFAKKRRENPNNMKKLIQKYGIEEANNKMNERNDKWQKSLYKNNDMNKVNKSKGLPKAKFIKKHGLDKYLQNRVNLLNSGPSPTTASKQSLIVFNELIKYLQNYNLSIFVGIDNNHEFSLYNKNYKKLYFYDFTILELNLIIEYNGCHIHPNKNILNEQEWNNWQHCYTNESADYHYELDKQKNKFAKDNGFNVITIWSSDTPEYNINKCIAAINTILNESL